MDNVRDLGNGWFLLDDDGRRRRVAIAQDGDTAWVFLDGQVATITRERPMSRRRKGSGTTDVMAPMPATVVSINTAVGNSVGDGETLIVLEAMKMELPIKAPRAGVVKAINCAKGDLVQPGVALIDIE